MRIDRYKVRQRMKAQDIKTFAELARRLDVSPQAVSRWFAGYPFASTNLEALCRILECKPNDIITIDEEDYGTPKQNAPAYLEPMTA